MEEPSSTENQEQQAFYAEEWRNLELSHNPGRSGWRTTVPAPDFMEFAEWLIQQRITGTALDMGCGGGRHSIVLAKTGFEVYGIDFAEAAIGHATRYAADEKLSDVTHFEIGDVLSLPYTDKMFDIVNDDGCLHHLNPVDWPTYIQGVKRVLKQNGILRIKTFSKNCEYFMRNSADGSQWVRLKGSGYTYFFDEKDFHKLFRQYFELLKFEEQAHTQACDKKFFFILARSL